MKLFPVLSLTLAALLVLTAFCKQVENKESVKNDSQVQKGGFPDSLKIYKTDAEWKMILTPEQYEVTRQKGTERACSGEFWKNHKAGVYKCVCCDLPLFRSDTKFESGTGWPSFFNPIDPTYINNISDNSYGIERTEIQCARCGAHLGHVFEDGPPPSGLRYCMNSVSLTFEEDK